jgi:hypothetical protein
MRVDAEPLVDLLEVFLDRGYRDAQFVPYRSVGRTGRHMLHDIALSLREARRAAARAFLPTGLHER